MIELQNVKHTSKKSDDAFVSEIKLGQVLSHPKALNLLMQHLAREFSMECLLSLIEFIQFQDYVFDYIVNNNIPINLENTKKRSSAKNSAVNVAIDVNDIKQLGGNIGVDLTKTVSNSSVTNDEQPQHHQQQPPKLIPDSGFNSPILNTGNYKSSIKTVIRVDTEDVDEVGNNSGQSQSIGTPTISLNDVNSSSNNIISISNPDIIMEQFSVGYESIKRQLISRKYEISLPYSIPQSCIVYDELDKSVLNENGIEIPLPVNEDSTVNNDNNDDIDRETEQKIQAVDINDSNNSNNGNNSDNNNNNSDVNNSDHDEDNNNELLDLSWKQETKIRCYRLYKKYVALGSEYEINVSYHVRMEIIKIMCDFEKYMENDEIDELMLLNMFNQCCQQMIHLIHGSFSRFKSSHHFTRFLGVCQSFTKENINGTKQSEQPQPRLQTSVSSQVKKTLV